MKIFTALAILSFFMAFVEGRLGEEKQRSGLVLEDAVEGEILGDRKLQWRGWLDSAKKAVDGAAKDIANGAKDIGDRIGDAVEDAGEAAGDAADDLKESIVDGANGAGKALLDVGGDWYEAGSSFIEGAGDVFNNAYNELVSAANYAGSAIMGSINEVLGKVKDIYTCAMDKYNDTVNLAKSTGKKIKVWAITIFVLGLMAAIVALTFWLISRGVELDQIVTRIRARGKASSAEPKHTKEKRADDSDSEEFDGEKNETNNNNERTVMSGDVDDRDTASDSDNTCGGQQRQRSLI